MPCCLSQKIESQDQVDEKLEPIGKKGSHFSHWYQKKKSEKPRAKFTAKTLHIKNTHPSPNSLYLPSMNYFKNDVDENKNVPLEREL